MAENLDTGRPHPARVYDYLLGDKDNFAADRAVAAEGLKANPNAATAPRQNRAFLQRTVRFNKNSGKCLDVPAASTADSVQLVQYTCNGSAAQSFRLG